MRVLVESDYKALEDENINLRMKLKAAEQRISYLSDTLGYIYLTIKERINL